jgi:hypothetical protein
MSRSFGLRWTSTAIVLVLLGWSSGARAQTVPSTVSYCGAPSFGAWKVAWYNSWEAAYGKAACGIDQLGFAETATQAQVVSIPCSAACGCGHVLPVTCNKSFTCPSNATLDADPSTCSCAPSYVAGGGQCACPANANDAAGGGCVCNDGFTMQNGRCVPICADPNASWNGAACVCNAPYVLRDGICSPTCSEAICGACSPDATPASIEGSSVDFNASVKCGAALGGSGDLGISFSNSTSSSIGTASCGNGCVSQADLATNVSLTLGMCKTSEAISVSTTEHDSTTYATMCENNSCKTVCDPSRACRHSTSAVSTTVNKTWRWDIGTADSFSGAAFQLKARCSASAGVTIGLNGSYETTENDGFPGSCASCTRAALDGSVTGSGRGGCSLTFSLGDPAVLDAVQTFVPRQLIPSFSVDCSDCLTLDIGATLGVSHQAGECGSSTCLNASVFATGRIQSPNYCSTLFGRSVSMRVAGSLDGRCTGSACTSGSTADCSFTPSFQPSVAGRCRNLVGP